jgi:LmbE family N-acetylglucosaminyl deacetylase
MRLTRKAVTPVSAVILICLALPVYVTRTRSDARPPAQNFGLSGLQQELRKLRTTARLIHTTAHPDDEDSGMLTLESRGLGATVLLLTLNRGEGGQNKTGGELLDALGVLRTLELLAADGYYGAEQRFSRVADFGFSKSAEETFQQWHGHDTALGDMVRVIRTFRPDVLVSRFQGAPRDGHGHHQASGILSREAFRAAADPTRFPDQLKEGLDPWQALKLYMDGVKPNEDYSVRLDTGRYDPALGCSYLEFALEGYRHHLSQGSGGIGVSPGRQYSYYKRLEPALRNGGHESSFFDGIDTTLPGLAARMGPEEAKTPFLRPALVEMDKCAAQAASVFVPDDPGRVAGPLLTGLKVARDIVTRLETAPLSHLTKADLLNRLNDKVRQFEKAANLALGADLEASVDVPSRRQGEDTGFPDPQQTFSMAVPGQTFTVTASFQNRSTRTISVDEIGLDAPKGWTARTLKNDLRKLEPGDWASTQFSVTVPADAAYTRPYWHRTDPAAETVFAIDSPEYLTLPFPPPPVMAFALYSTNGLAGLVRSVVNVKYIDPLYGQEQRPLPVGPPISIELQPAHRIIATGSQAAAEVNVGVRNNRTVQPGIPLSAKVQLQAPPGWTVEPASIQAMLSREGEFNSYTFKVTPGRVSEGRFELRAVAELEGKKYAEGVAVVSRHDLGSFYYYHQATERISSVDVIVPPGLRVGYIMGAGDDIPEALKQLGIAVEVIGAQELATGDLSRFDTILVGIRAYDVRRDVRDNNKRLLEYVSRGGTLLVQYNQSVSTFNAGGYAPYPATASTLRVTVEEAPVTILEPKDSLFLYPNRITARDFDGWVQERGVYFMEKWDSHFTPLLASNDPGEKPLAGGMLRANYGKGTYIYTGYAFFRQLPAGVPGAIRLFVNLLSTGRRNK